MMFGRTPRMITASEALPGRSEQIVISAPHLVLGTPLHAPFQSGAACAVFAEGCFWGVERVFWQVPGVISTAVGYVGGFTSNPTYQEVCSGRTGHTEGVLVVFDPDQVSFEQLLKVFWESHDPTQGMRQGNDTGTQYRSGVYAIDQEQLDAANASRDRFQKVLTENRFDEITTEIVALGNLNDHWFYAEDYHQQYLAKNPGGYCGLGSTGMSCPIGIAQETD
ncbi:MAG: peptide-methionine (S)-S-oxide reductase MsrA [Microthrixaceae bacterium]